MLDAARAAGMPVTTRGAGTSCAGNAVGPGLILDTSRHLTRDQRASTPRRARPWSSPGWSSQPAGRGRAARAAVRPRPVHPQPLHHRRHDRQQRLRPSGARLRPDRGQRRRPGRASPARGERLRLDATTTRRPVGRADRPAAGGAGRPGHHPHRVRPLRPPGVRLQPRAPAAREPVRRRPLPGRHRRHAGRHRGGDRTAGRRRPAQDHDRARLSVDGRRRATRPRSSSRTPPPPPKGSTAGSSRSSAGPGATPPCRRSPAATAGCSSSWSATTRRARASGPSALLADGRRAGRLRGRRPGPGSGAVEDPRGRRRAGRGQPGRAGLPGLGGRRGADPAPRRLPPRLRRPARRARAGRAAVRPLRRRLCALPDRLPADHRGRRRGLPVLRRPGGDAGGQLWRLDVGRARRWPGPVGAAAQDVLRRRPSTCSARSRRHSTRTTCSTPACWCDPRPVDADVRALALVGKVDHFAEEVHHCTGVGKCLANTTAGTRRDVPVLPGDPGGEGLHPRSGPGAAGDDQRRA